MPYTVRHTTVDDFCEIKSIYTYARRFMKETGNPNQWGDVTPPDSVVLADIENGLSFAVCDGETVVGVFFLSYRRDETYKIIKGAWLNNDDYAVIHRIASTEGAHGILATAVGFAFEKTDNIRIDTHSDNKVMQHLLKKLGFCECGIIRLSDGRERIAYHKKKE